MDMENNSNRRRSRSSSSSIGSKVKVKQLDLIDKEYIKEIPQCRVNHNINRLRANFKMTKKNIDLLCEELINSGGNVAKALRAVNITQTSFYRWKRKAKPKHRQYNPMIAEAVKRIDKAIEIGVQTLIDEAKRRAVNGVKKAVMYKGEVVGYEQQYSDTLLKFLIAGYDKRFATTRNELSGVNGSPIPVVSVNLTAEEASQLYFKKLKEAEQDEQEL